MKLMEQLRVFLALVIIGITGHAQVGIGTITPDASAALDLTSTTKGVLLPRMEYNQMYHIVSPEEGLLVYCIDCDSKGLYYFDGTDFISTTTGLISEPPSVVTSTGRTWMDRNLGASQVATSLTDEASYGYLYQWGRASDGHEKRTSGSINMLATTAEPNLGNPWDGLYAYLVDSDGNLAANYWLSSGDNTLWQGINGTNNPCPEGYRVPTRAEWEAELLSWSSASATAAFESNLKLSLSGVRYGSFISEEDRTAFYQSSSTAIAVDSNAYALLIGKDGLNEISGIYSRALVHANPVRCIRD